MQRNKRAKAAQPDPEPEKCPSSPNTQFWLVQNNQRAAHTASLASQASQADLKLKIIDAEVALEQMKNLLSAEVHQEEARQRAITHRCWRGDLPADAIIAIFSSAGPRSRALLAHACIQFKATMEVGCQTAAFGPSGTDSVPG